MQANARRYRQKGGKSHKGVEKMKYGFMPKLMWVAYKGTFKKQLTKTLGEDSPNGVMKLAHRKYKEILFGIDEFEKGDRFLINILSCAMPVSYTHLERCVLAYEKRNCKGFSHRGRIPRLVFGKSDAYSLSYKGNAASLLLQKSKADRLHHGGGRSCV